MVTIAPAERIGTALQGALMVREGPRRGSDAGETGDWSHVDVYLTKTMDYRALLHLVLEPGPGLEPRYDDACYLITALGGWVMLCGGGGGWG